MNKAFVREPDADARVTCPRCGSVGNTVGNGPIELYVPPGLRDQMRNAAWCCSNSACEVVYYNMFEQTVRASDLVTPVYPYDPDAPICACFGFTLQDVEAEADEAQPLRIRALLARSQSSEARCQAVAVDGCCCVREVQRLYMKLKSSRP